MLKKILTSTPWVTIIASIICIILSLNISIINPFNINWMLTDAGDPAHHFVGWYSYLKAPWSFPLGAHSLYGSGIMGGSLILSDSLPLLAIPFKALSPVTSTAFQYYGIWLALCIFLSALFADKFAKLFQANSIERLSCSILVSMSPFLLQRMFGHYSLAGHFVLIWALLLTITQSNKVEWQWPVCISIASLIQPYMWAMVIGIYMINVYVLLLENKKTNQTILLEISTSVGASILAMWTAGYFVLDAKSTQGPGYGLYSANIIGLFDPEKFSYFIADLKNGAPGQGEGYAYIGLGNIIAFISASIYYVAMKLRKIKIQLPASWGLIFISFFIFSLSNHIFLLGEKIFYYETPLLNIFKTFHATGRFMWVPAYIVILLSIYILLKYKPYKKATTTILLTFATLQIADLYPLEKELHSKFSNKSNWNYSLDFENWESISKNRTKILMVPTQATPPGYMPLALFAADKGMRTNFASSGRVNESKLLQENKQNSFDLLQGTPQSDAIYIIMDPQIIAQLSSKGKIVNLDGYHIYVMK